MPDHGYARVPYPWRATIDHGNPAPARFFAALVKQALRYGSPARRRFGPLAAAAVRSGLPPTRLILHALRRGNTQRPDLDRLKEVVASVWPQLAESSRRLPADPPALAVVELERASARTVLVFASTPQPLLVIKFPHASERVMNEVVALREAAGRFAPRYLGTLLDGHVQEGLPGQALRVDPLSPSTAAAAPWLPTHDSLTRGLVDLAAATTRPQRPPELDSGFVDAADHSSLGAATRRRATEAGEELRAFDRGVLKHGDTSAQNCLFVGDALEGFIDWEAARLPGAPGFDILNAGIALLEHGIGLTRWSEQRIRDAFEAAWRQAPLFNHLRARAIAAAEAAGGSESQAHALTTAFFVRRLAHRLEHPRMFATGPAVAARMLEVVCAS